MSIRRRSLPAARYFVLQYHGFAVRDQRAIDALLRFPATAIRMSGAGAQDFAARMSAYRQNSEVLFDDGDYLLLWVRSGIHAYGK